MDEGGRELGSVRLPLNSKRLTSNYLRRLAAQLELPTSASVDDLRQMVDGKLTDEGRDVMNVQVILQGTDSRCEFTLEDEDGQFLTVPAAEQDEHDAELPSELGEHGQSEDENEDQQRGEVEGLQEENQSLRDEVSALQQKLEDEKTRFRDLWRTNCKCLAEYDALVASRDDQIEELKRQLRAHRSGSPPLSVVASSSRPSSRGTEDPRDEPVRVAAPRGRRGKAPPVDQFTGENVEMRLDDWLPSLERAQAWNDWTGEEMLLQLAGHLCGQALQEWSLLSSSEKASYAEAVKALKMRLDPGSRALAAQDFRHTSQGDQERVADFIRRLERTFYVAYGREGMSTETRNTLLHGQLQDALKHELMQALAVSGAQSYQELCLAARNEEKRLTELKKRQQYMRGTPHQQQPKRMNDRPPAKPSGATPSGRDGTNTQTWKCYFCQEPGHLARNCPKKRPTQGSQRRPGTTPSQGSQRRPGATNQVTTSPEDGKRVRFEALQEQLCSDDSSDDDVRVGKLTDEGSQPQCVKLQIQGVPAYGLIDSGADITIMGGILFKKVAAVARFRKRDLKKADKTPRNYDHTPFTLDGRIDMDLTFDGKTMCTPVYIKADAHDQLLLSEGVCRQLGILHYHPSVEPWRGGRARKRSRQQGGN